MAEAHDSVPAGPHLVHVEHFDSFYRREYRATVALAFALSGSRTAAEDLAQDAMTAVATGTGSAR